MNPGAYTKPLTEDERAAGLFDPPEECPRDPGHEGPLSYGAWRLVPALDGPRWEAVGITCATCVANEGASP